jgi:hypothetical protein
MSYFIKCESGATLPLLSASWLETDECPYESDMSRDMTNLVATYSSGVLEISGTLNVRRCSGARNPSTLSQLLIIYLRAAGADLAI